MYRNKKIIKPSTSKKSNDKTKFFCDHLFNQLTNATNDVMKYLKQEEYDTESIQYDLEKDKNNKNNLTSSNIEHYIENIHFNIYNKNY